MSRAARTQSRAIVREQYRCGFTLIEMLVVLAIATLIMLALALFYVRFDRFLGYQAAYGSVASSASLALQDLTSDIASGRYVLSSYTFGAATYSSGANTLVLQLPSVSASTGEFMPGTYDYVAYYLVGTTLYRQTLAAAGSIRVSRTQQLSPSVTALSFAYDNTDFSSVSTVSATLATGTTTVDGSVSGGGSITQRMLNF